MPKLSIFLCCLGFVLWTNSALQAQNEFFQQPTFTISVFQHNVGVPFKDYLKLPLNLGFTLGAEFGYGGKAAGRHFQRFEVGFYRHENLNSTVWIKSDFIRRFNTKSPWFVDVQTGLGYAHSFDALATYQLDDEGRYQAKSRSKSALLFDAGLGVGYELKVGEKLNLSPYVRYEGLLQWPYSKLAPVLPQTLLHAGTKLRW